MYLADRIMVKVASFCFIVIEWQIFCRISDFGIFFLTMGNHLFNFRNY